MERGRDPLREIKNYVHDCRHLVLGINHLLQDQQRVRDGWTLHYAVDFSEIHRFILPEPEPGPFIDGWRGDGLRQFVTLARFFGDRTLILPEPYARELGTFVRMLVSRTIVDELGQVIESLDVLESSEAVGVRQLAAEAGLRPLTKAEIETVISFFEHKGVTLAAQAHGRGWSVMQRLTALLSRKSFVSLESVTGLPSIPLDETAVRRSLLLLESRRRDHATANYHDAVVIEQIRAANELLAPRKQVVLLVTRSIHVADVVNADYGFVRHPRIFSAIYRPSGGGDAESFLVMLSARRESLLLFIHAAEAALAQGRESDPRDGRALSEIDSMLSRIREEWSSGESLATALVLNDSEEKGSTALELLRLLREHDYLAAAVRGRLALIFDELQRYHSLIGVSLQSGGRDRESTGNIPYEIELESLDLGEHLAALASRWSIALSESLAFLDRLAAKAGAEHDVLLGLAVCLGAIGRWSVAERYAIFAERQFEESGKSAYEALFFAGVCKRKKVLGLQRSREVTAALREALQLLDRCSAERQFRDPRLLHERALLLMSLMEEDASVTRETVAELLNAALTLDPSARLRLQILNSRVVLEIRMHGEIAAALDALEQELSRQFDSRGAWPPQLVDTAVYATFWLRGATAPPIALETWIEELRYVSAELSPQERVWVDRHLSEINATLVTRDR